MQHGARVITHIHGGVDRHQEKANPIDIATAQQMGVGAHDQSKRLAMTELVVTPPFEPPEDRVESLVRVFLKLSKDSDVTCVADFLG